MKEFKNAKIQERLGLNVSISYMSSRLGLPAVQTPEGTILYRETADRWKNDLTALVQREYKYVKRPKTPPTPPHSKHVAQTNQQSKKDTTKDQPKNEKQEKQEKADNTSPKSNSNLNSNSNSNSNILMDTSEHSLQTPKSNEFQHLKIQTPHYSKRREDRRKRRDGSRRKKL